MFFFEFSAKAGEGDDKASDGDSLFCASFYKWADTLCIATHVHIAFSESQVGF